MRKIKAEKSFPPLSFYIDRLIWHDPGAGFAFQGTADILGIGDEGLFAADGFGRLQEGWVIAVHQCLRYDGSNVLFDASLVQLILQALLEGITDGHVPARSAASVAPAIAAPTSASGTTRHTPTRRPSSCGAGRGPSSR